MSDRLRAPAWALAWGGALGWVAQNADVPWWLRVPGFVALGFGISWATRRREVRWWWLRWRHRHEYNAPVVLDEDGVLRTPLLLPGESLHVCGQNENVVHAYVLRRNGSIRAAWPDESARH